MAQLNNAVGISFGPFSLLQIVRSHLLLALLALIAWQIVRDRNLISRIPLAAAGALAVLAMACTKEIITTGTLSVQSVGAYGQMSYWVIFWITASILISDTDGAEILLRGFAAGAAVTAACVVVGFVHGGLNYYADDSVRSSSGWFDTAKYITGLLVCGTITLLYLGRKRDGWLYPALAGLCCIACILTYARAGAVALTAVLVWFIFWWFFLGRDVRRKWLTRFLLLITLGAAVAPVFIHPDVLLARWSDLQDPDEAGSGRASFWKIAADHYIDGTPAQQALGSGFDAMAQMLYTETGSDIKHCHNDLLDMALVGGAVGIGWFFFMVGSFVLRISQLSLTSVEGAAAAAVLLAYVLHGQLTGQLWSPDAMAYN
ncbi:MAG: O-antigen ligase family protein, partial [Acidobacteriaceae bacterium]